MSKPKLIIVGGANGSGKTTVALKYAGWQNCPYIGADAIAEELSPGSPERAAIAAGKEFIRRMAVILDDKTTAVIESTLAGRTLNRMMGDARNAGFGISIAYVFLHSADECVKRVKERVQKGGHSVPEPDIRRRFLRSLRNFWHFYRPLADNWTLLYNSGEEIVDVASGSGTSKSMQQEQLFSLFQHLVETAND
jgi:predicted ABC-type ATPase